MKKSHIVCLILLFGNRVLSLFQLYNYSNDGYLVEFITLLTIILLERIGNIVYSQYYIYRAYHNIHLNMVQLICSLAFLDYINMGLLRKEDLRFCNGIFIRNMNITTHFLSIIPLIFNFICINFTNGEQHYLVYPLTIFYLLFTMSYISTVYIYENQTAVPFKKYLFTFTVQYIRSYSIWNISSQLFYQITPFLLIYCVMIILSSLLLFGISKEGGSSSISKQNVYLNNPNINNNSINQKNKSRFIKVLITQFLMLVQIENCWAFQNKKNSQPCIRKVAQSISIYVYFIMIYVIKIFSFTFVNYYDLPNYAYSFVCIFEILLATKNLFYYERYGPYQEAVQIKHDGSLQELNLEKCLIQKYQGKLLLSKFNFSIVLRKQSLHSELKIDTEQFSKHICSILFKISQNQCRISINISNEEELILSRKDTEIIFGIKRSANDFIITFLLSLYAHIQAISQFQKSKILNIYFTDKEQLSVTLKSLEKSLVQASWTCIQPKMVLNFKGIQTLNQMNCNFQQQYLMTYLFNTHISSFMSFNPNAIIFDLFEDTLF